MCPTTRWGEVGQGGRLAQAGHLGHRGGDHRLLPRAPRPLQVPPDRRHHRGPAPQPHRQDPQARPPPALLGGPRPQDRLTGVEAVRGLEARCASHLDLRCGVRGTLRSTSTPGAGLGCAHDDCAHRPGDDRDGRGRARRGGRLARSSGTHGRAHGCWSTPSSASGTATGSPTAGRWRCRPAWPSCPSCSRVTGLAADIDDDRPAAGARRDGQARSLPGPGSNDALAEAVARRVERGRRRDRADLRPRLRPALDDDGDGPGRARRQPDLRDPARPAGAAQVRPGGGLHARPGALPVGLGFLLLVAGGAFGDAMVTRVRLERGPPLTGGTWLRWPVGLAMLVFAIAVLLDHAPRRRQPALTLAGPRVGRSRCC